MSSTAATLDPVELAASFGELPTLAPVAVELLRLADDDRASLEDIAAVIGRDPALASQLLRMANSAVYGMGGHTTSLARAASVLGLRTLKLLSLTFSVITRPEDSAPTSLSTWRHTLATGAMARAISTRRDPRVADESFIVGLLGNLGRLALADRPVSAGTASTAPMWLASDEELAAFASLSDAVTAQILDNWGLPTVLGDAVRHRADPQSTHGVAARVARVLNVADAAAHLVIAGPEDAGAALERYRAKAAEHLQLTEAEAEALLVDAAPALEEIAAMFRTDRPNEVPLDVLLLRAKERLARLSLAMVAALSQEQIRTRQLASENRRLAAEAATDALTSLPNRRAYTAFLERTLAARQRHTTAGALGLLMIDLDRFKLVNDTHGHIVGDDVLRLVGARLALITRREEFAARIGGEEFVVVVPVTNRDELALAAERVRKAISDNPLDTQIGPLRVTASIGAACLDAVDPTSASQLYASADAALREAKESGRNRVVSAPTM